MSNLEPIVYSHLLFAPPTDLPFGVNSGGSVFGAERVRKEGTPKERRSFHHAIDLFYRGPPSIQQRAYAVNGGTVEFVQGSSGNFRVVIRHNPHSSGFYTVYKHLDTHNVDLGNQVARGQQIGTIAGDHLHFVWLRLADQADPYQVPDCDVNLIPLDPTLLLYSFDVNCWAWGNGTKVARHVHASYFRISRVRIMPWPSGNQKRPATWLFEVLMPDSESYYLPIRNALPQEELLVEVLREANRNKNKVKLNWRDSFFYPVKKSGVVESRKMIEGVRLRP